MAAISWPKFDAKFSSKCDRCACTINEGGHVHGTKDMAFAGVKGKGKWYVACPACYEDIRTGVDSGRAGAHADTEVVYWTESVPVGPDGDMEVVSPDIEALRAIMDAKAEKDRKGMEARIVGTPTGRVDEYVAGDGAPFWVEPAKDPLGGPGKLRTAEWEQGVEGDFTEGWVDPRKEGEPVKPKPPSKWSLPGIKERAEWRI